MTKATMINPIYVQTMAHYNQWQNTSIYKAASMIDDQARLLDRGSFFGSIHGTLSHLLWGDQLWMSRFSENPKPRAASISESARMVTDWRELNEMRIGTDNAILEWSRTVDEDWLNGDLTWYSGLSGKNNTKPCGLLVMHMFNHQTHHRGQVHAMLTAAGAKPDDTDLFIMPGT